MKILFYIDSMQRGGANRVMANLVRYFSDREYDTLLVNDGTPASDELEYEVSEQTKRIFLPDEAKKFGALRKNLIRIRALRKIIRSEKPDLILSFMGPPNVRMIFSSAFLPPKKIVSVRNDPYREYGKGLYKWLIGLLFGFADGVVFQTEEAASYFPNFVKKKSRTIFNPVNPKFFDAKWAQNKKSIAVIGRLEPQKNPMNAIRAFEAVSEIHSEYTLDFYGDGSLRESLQKYVEEQGLGAKVFFHGKCQQVEKVLEGAALYVLSSDYEGMPNALMEAMAVGTPCVSTDCPCGGPRTLFGEASCGILVPCGDPEKLCDAMKRMLSDEKLRASFSTSASERAKEFHPDKVFAEWDAYFTVLVQNKS